MIEKFLDPYELKARIAPGLILILPLLVDVVYAAPILSSWPIFAASGVCTLALLYGLSLVVRALGAAIEPSLWDGWGGPPSTRFMRYRDSTFGAELKLSIQGAVAKRLSARLLTPDDEAKNPGRADQAILDAFRQLRQYLRQHDPDGLWFKHNVEYGFCRNLLGCRVMWALVSAGSTVFGVVYATKTGVGLLNAASAFGCLSLLCAVCIGWLILPGAAKRTGEAYAESAWMSFLRTADDSRPVNA
jgi:hypothetical protein